MSANTCDHATLPASLTTKLLRPEADCLHPDAIVIDGQDVTITTTSSQTTPCARVVAWSQRVSIAAILGGLATYRGTILVDLEQRCVVDLLTDRSADTLVTWLQDQPGVEIISRDRGSSYTEGARRGAPDAVLVADRWHLLANLREALQRLLPRKHTAKGGRTPEFAHLGITESAGKPCNCTSTTNENATSYATRRDAAAHELSVSDQESKKRSLVSRLPHCNLPPTAPDP